MMMIDPAIVEMIARNVAPKYVAKIAYMTCNPSEMRQIQEAVSDDNPTLTYDELVTAESQAALSGYKLTRNDVLEYLMVLYNEFRARMKKEPANSFRLHGTNDGTVIVVTAAEMADESKQRLWWYGTPDLSQ